MLYDEIGENYNNTRQADQFIAETIFKLLNILPNEKILDIGCGTGNYTIAMAEKKMDMVGIEPSSRMLEIAQKRNGSIDWILGQAEEILAEEAAFEGIFGVLTVHHWQNINRAFLELYRVLKENCNIVLFTSTPEQMKGYWLNHYFPKMLEQSILQMPSIDRLKQAAINSGFKAIASEKYFVKNDLKDHFLYVGKNRPELYFEERIRSGISSFAALSNSIEVQNGLQRLNKDIQNGKFEDIRKAYENDNGDYLFVTIMK